MSKFELPFVILCVFQINLIHNPRLDIFPVAYTYSNERDFSTVILNESMKAANGILTIIIVER